MPLYDGNNQILISGFGTGLTDKQKLALQRPYSTGSLQLNDGDDIKDASGDDRITFTNAGSLILKDEDGNPGITLNTDQSTTFAAGVTVSAGDATLTAGTLDIHDGGAVTQASSGRDAGVTLSKVTGKVTGDDDTLAQGANIKHTVTNTTVGVNDVILISKVSGDDDTFALVDKVSAGSFDVRLYRTAGSGNDTTAFVYNFVVIKGSNS